MREGASDLRGREVSVRAVVPCWEAALERGLTRDALAAGTGYSPEHLESPRERISWEGFAVFLGTVGRALDDAELVRVGVAAVSSPVLRALVLPGRLLFQLPDLMEWATRPGGPLDQTFAVHEVVTGREGDRLQLELRMRAGYAPAREHWLLTHGAIIGLAEAFAVEEDVTLEIRGDAALYELTITRPTLLSRVRRGASFAIAVRQGARELQLANDALHERYRALQNEVAARTRAEEQLRALNASLEARIAERTRALEAANHELAEANRELATFAASAAHDIRAPLRAISGYASTLRDDYDDRLDDDPRRRLDRITDGAKRMGELLDALLGLAKVSRVEIARVPVNLTHLAEESIAQLRAAEPARAVEVAIERDLTTRGDRNLLRSVIDNLLGNAWKFTRDRSPGHIEVRRTVDGASEVFSVRDDGVGFDMRHAHRLFEPFVRLHTEREFLGTGIGLAVASRIVRRHGGRLWADARPGAGATFSFTLTPR